MLLHLFYFYGLVQIVTSFYNVIVKQSYKQGANVDATNVDENIKTIKMEAGGFGCLLQIINMLWLVAGIYMPEGPMFLSILVSLGISLIAMGSASTDSQRQKAALFFTFIRMILILMIVYSHFNPYFK